VLFKEEDNCKLNEKTVVKGYLDNKAALPVLESS
jgi:hypothetical protein